MGKLIDADAFERSVMFGDAEDMQDVIYALREYPTAYAPDKVVEQLKAEFKKYYGENWNKAPYLIKAIEIVKAGGIDAEH